MVSPSGRGGEFTQRITHYLAGYSLIMTAFLTTVARPLFGFKVKQRAPLRVVVIERERMVRSVLNGPSVRFLSQPLRAGLLGNYRVSQWRYDLNLGEDSQLAVIAAKPMPNSLQIDRPI